MWKKHTASIHQSDERSDSTLSSQRKNGFRGRRYLPSRHRRGFTSDARWHGVSKAVFPKSIYDNIAYGPRLQGIRKRIELDELVETSLSQAAIWDEVKDRLTSNALGMSGGQQQRLCLARALAVKPEILLMDEPTSALDPKATAKIEDLIAQLREQYTLIIVTHNMQQAARVSDLTAFMYEGTLVEFGKTKEIFTRPKKKQTEDYITGRFG